MKLLYKALFIATSFLIGPMAYADETPASQFQILFSFKFDSRDKKGQDYIFETKNLNAPEGAPPSEVFQWHLLTSKEVLNLAF